jgi:Zn-dependent M16 (insulinase) family peptidase
LTRRTIFENHPVYSIDSGGDPAAIPDLTYDQFKSFHTKYYHPGLARFYFYGDQKDISTVERLAMLETFLTEFGPPPEPEETIPIQQRPCAPREVVEPYSVDPESTVEPKQFVTLAWLVTEDEALDPATDFALGVLNNLWVFLKPERERELCCLYFLKISHSFVYLCRSLPFFKPS